VVAADELAKRDAERGRQRRKHPFVGRHAGLQTLDRAREYAGVLSELVDAVAARDAKPEDPRR
jgi:hypothetical protein